MEEQRHRIGNKGERCLLGYSEEEIEDYLNNVRESYESEVGHLW